MPLFAGLGHPQPGFGLGTRPMITQICHGSNNKSLLKCLCLPMLMFHAAATDEYFIVLPLLSVDFAAAVFATAVVAAVITTALKLSLLLSLPLPHCSCCCFHHHSVVFAAAVISAMIVAAAFVTALG